MQEIIPQLCILHISPIYEVDGRVKSLVDGSLDYNMSFALPWAVS